MAATDLVREDTAQNLATRLASECKALRTLINANAADLSALTTSAKGNIVAAINELNAAVDALSGGGSASTLDDLTDVVVASAAVGDILRHNGTNFINTPGTSHYEAAGTTAAHASDSSDAHDAAAISFAPGASGMVSTDAQTAIVEVWDEIAAQVAALVDASPGALDTLRELATALGDDANFAATTSTALGNRLRVDAAQGLTGPQQAQGIANLGIVRSAVDLVSLFETGLV